MPEETGSQQRIVRLTALEDVLGRIHTRVKPVTPRSTAELASAIDRTLADDVAIEQSCPQATLSLRDGWALQSDLTTDASSYAPAPIPSALRTDAGTPLPPGADAVAVLDTVMVRDGALRALAPVVSGEGVLPVGIDAASGAILVRAGRRLSPLHIALLAATGIERVRIREPRLRIARAGPGPDRVLDAVVEIVTDAIGRAGALAVPAEMNATMAHALTHPDSDAVVIVGGTGCGRNDNAVTTLAAVGCLDVHGVALVPGETAAFGFVSNRPVLILPGRLDAALAVWHMLGQAMVSRLAANEERPLLRAAKLTRKVSSSAGLAELVPVRCEGEFATPLASGYLPMWALAQANGWILIPAGSEGHQAHTKVLIRAWP